MIERSKARALTRGRGRCNEGLYALILKPYILAMTGKKTLSSGGLVDEKTVSVVTSSSNAFINRITTDISKKIDATIKQGGGQPPKEQSK